MITFRLNPTAINFDSGTAGRDDDRPQKYGSVVYVYNDNSVRLYAPKMANGHDAGYAVFTGKKSLSHSLSLSLSFNGLFSDKFIHVGP